MRQLVIFLIGLVTGFALAEISDELWEAARKPVATEQAVMVKVKRSLSGICHPEGSQFFDYVKYYIEYDSLSQCVLEGGRLPQRVKSGVQLHDNYSDFAADNSVAE